MLKKELTPPTLSERGCCANDKASMIASLMIQLLDDEGGQGMVEYLLIVSLVVLTIVALFAGLMHLFSK